MIEKHHDKSLREDVDKQSTVIWGRELESGDFIKVPRTLFRLGRFDERAGSDLQPRHLLLLLALAARRFKQQPLRAKWTDLAADLGTKPDTVRKWAYELRRMNLLRISRPQRETHGFDRRNEFSIKPFVELIQEAYPSRQMERANYRDYAKDQDVVAEQTEPAEQAPDSVTDSQIPF